jgi:hypothetical protein
MIDDSRARKLSNDLKRCSYYETCATYGLNVERVFQDGESASSISCTKCWRVEGSSSISCSTIISSNNCCKKDGAIVGSSNSYKKVCERMAKAALVVQQYYKSIAQATIIVHKVGALMAQAALVVQQYIEFITQATIVI